MGDWITFADQTSLNHGAVEGHPSAELADDTLKYGAILLQGVGVEGGHDATTAQFRRMDDDAADPQTSTWPFTLSQALNAADDDIGPQASAVETHMVYRAIGGHQQRQYVKTLRTVVVNQLRVRPRGLFHESQSLRRIPGMTRDKGNAIAVQCSLQGQQTVVRS